MPSTTISIEAEAYKSVQASPFTKTHSRPSRRDYKTLKKEASDLASELEDIMYDWSRSTTDKEYSLLAEIISKDEYQHLTNLAWAQETEPETYDPAIGNTTVTHTRKPMEQEWEQHAKHGQSGKVSSVESQLICVMHWTKTGTPS
jgi:hypothetical protein